MYRKSHALLIINLHYMHTNFMYITGTDTAVNLNKLRMVFMFTMEINDLQSFNFY